MAAVATTIGAVFALALWLDQRSVKRDAWLGIALGLLILTKFSAVLFVFASAIGVFATRWLSTRSVKHPGMNQRLSFARLGVPLGVMAVLVWAGYQFSVGPIRTLETRPHEDIDRVVGTDGPLHDLVYDVIEAPIYPASEMIGGLGQLLSHNQQGHVAYLLGEKSQDGFWYFFPVAFAVKTPLPFLVFIIVGAFATIRMVRKDSQWLLLVPLVSSLAILISVLPTSINIGLRHILPIYAMLSIVAAVGVAALTSRISRTSSTMMAAALLLWYIHASVAAHPSYLSYFNELAGPNPEHIIVDSDLDWGQDIGNLAKELKNRDIKTVHLALFTAADLSNFEWPEHTFALEDHFRAEGWIAASLFRIKVDERLEWLENYEPVAKIGSSIHLYYIPGSSDG
jgi:4-amino-4-deoxy-L-arabinose transferase-like glycosyltransferase